MNAGRILPPFDAELVGRAVKHQGQAIGTITELRSNMTNGRRYAFVRPYDETDAERRIPLDELVVQP